ncbi:MAG: response regulator transcription factor [Propionibacteriaceae bacterium]|nr:response regulator transcription factor [Propionibacteriaceae bacterium]
MLLNIAVVEDSEEYMSSLLEYLARFKNERGMDMRVTAYTDGALLLEDYKAGFDIILMDIEMPVTDGMTAAEQIRQTDPEVVIIFITNMAQYAIRGYAVEALDYVMKPVTYFAFSQRLDRAVARMRKRASMYITLNVSHGSAKVDVADIYYIESRGHNLVFHTAEGQVTTVGTMKEMEARLAEAGFARGNNCYLLNLRHVDGIRDGSAVVRGESLVLSRPRKAAFMEQLAAYVGGTLR